MDSQVLHVMTISNSIIGVSLLAMPYCFKQCGIILSILILIASSILSRLSCHLLLKSAILARRRTFEVLAFHTFGPFGKLVTEIGIIGFLIGTCIAFFVIMGDLGPMIVSKMTGTSSSETMRTSILMALALFCVLPLGLLRNIDSLSSVCTATIGFYFCLVIKIVAEAFPHLFTGDWLDKIELWRPSGILQCLPIFSMALSCQTQIFEIYQVVQNASLEKMNSLIKVAINICTFVYIFVGTFGYIAFCNQTFTGNILTSFSSSFLSDAIKMGFVLSVAFSFPLVIFPCRASLNSLLYKQAYSLHEGTDKYIPEGRFKAITFFIILIPLVIGIMIPNIELVLGLMGSTIGIMICVIFPATCFICISTKNTNERVLAQVMLFFGILIMVLGTYANLFTMESRSNIQTIPDEIKFVQTIPKVIDIPLEVKVPDVPKLIHAETNLLKDVKPMEDAVRREPPQPQMPSNVRIEKPPEAKIEEPQKLDVQNGQLSDVLKEAEVLKPGKAPNLPNQDQKHEMKVEAPHVAKIDSKEHEVRHEPPQPIEPIEPIKMDKPNAEITVKPLTNLGPKKTETKINQKKSVASDDKQSSVLNSKAKFQDKKPRVLIKQDAQPNEPKPVDINPPEILKPIKEVDKQSVDVEAIKKEEKELLEEEKAQLTEEEKKNFELLKTLEKQNEQQQKLVEESKKVLDQIKQRQQVLEEKKQRVIEKEKLVELNNEPQLLPDNSSNKTGEDVVKKAPPGVQGKSIIQENPLPLPLALSNTFNKSANPVEMPQGVKALPQRFENIPEAHVKAEPIEAVLHREIREANMGENVADNYGETGNNADEPHIKIDLKLSEPEMSLKKKELNDVSADVNLEVKPQSRDLKNYEITA